MLLAIQPLCDLRTLVVVFKRHSVTYREVHQAFFQQLGVGADIGHSVSHLVCLDGIQAVHRVEGAKVLH